MLYLRLWILVEWEMMLVSVGVIFNNYGVTTALETRGDWILHGVMIEGTSKCDWVWDFLVLTSQIDYLIFKGLNLIQ